MLGGKPEKSRHDIRKPTEIGIHKNQKEIFQLTQKFMMLAETAVSNMCIGFIQRHPDLLHFTRLHLVILEN